MPAGQSLVDQGLMGGRLPQEVIIGESSTRAAAILAGAVDLGSPELSSWLWLDGRRPTGFIS